jgi:Penicillin binding protein transpeptidase domain
MASLLLLAWSSPAGRVLSGLPQRIDPRANYLIFLHGRIVEEHGPHPTDPRFGAYEYQGILDSLAARGFAVIGEVRPQGTEIAAYSGHVVAQVQSLLAAGVPPRRIAVVGFSKGGAIALVAASRLHHPEVRFVSLAGCGDWLFKHFKVDLAGPALSLYDEADDLATSCTSVLSAGSNAARRREILLKVGKGHGTFYRPDPAWLDPLAAWLAAGAAAPPRQAAVGGPESPCRLALRRGTVCETAGEEASRWLALRHLAGAALMQDVQTGALVSFTSAPASASAAAARTGGSALVAGGVDVTTPLLPLSLAKVFLAASCWDRAAALPPGVDRDLHEMLVDGSDSTGRRLAIGLRRAVGSAAVLADLERFGLRSCGRAGASAPLPDDHFWRELAPRFVQRLRPATACVSIGPDDSDRRWASVLSIGEDGLTVTLLHVSRFLQAVGNGGLLVQPRALWDGGDRIAAPPPTAAHPEGTRIVAVSTAARLQAALSDAVLRGTAIGIRGLPGHGWTMGGKTGTGPGEAHPYDGCFAGLVFDGRRVARYAIASYVRRGGRGGGAAAQLAAELVARTLGLEGVAVAPRGPNPPRRARGERPILFSSAAGA